MAVLHMQRISICGLNKNRKQILEYLQRCGIIEIRDVLAEDSLFQKQDVSVSISLIERNIASVKEALKILESYIVEKNSTFDMLVGRKTVNTEYYNSFSERYESVLSMVSRINSIEKEIVEGRAEILKIKNQMEILLPWMQLDIPINFSGTKSTVAFIGSLPGNWEKEQIYEILDDMSLVEVDIVSKTKEQTCIFVLCLKEISDSSFEKLRSAGFSYPNFIIDKIPRTQIMEFENRINEIQISIIRLEEEIKSYVKVRDEIRFLQDYETMRTDKYEVISHLMQSKKVFVMEGYIPEKEVKWISQELNNRFDIGLELEQPSEGEDVPVLLQNNSFSSPLESTVEAYSPPGPQDVDPTMVMSLFYYVLFGIMLSDAGYGAILTAGCGFLLMKYKKTMEDAMKRTLKMFFFCGLSTIFWGIMFGSYFGDILDVISLTFFHKQITIPPLWFIPMNNPMKMLIFCLAFGTVHLFTGLGIKLYQCIKQKDYQSAIYDVIFWYILLISSILWLLPSQMVSDIVGNSIKLPDLLNKMVPYLFILSAIGIILTNGRESKSPFKRILKGLYAFYGITGYLSDVLSYSRLLALGLATGVICMVINKMASMLGGGVIGAILFTIIVLFGNVLNIAINALGAYVHTNRLQYVEFFGKFYGGGGRKFNPFSMRTKYYKIKEKTKNE